MEASRIYCRSPIVSSYNHKLLHAEKKQETGEQSRWTAVLIHYYVTVF